MYPFGGGYPKLLVPLVPPTPPLRPRPLLGSPPLNELPGLLSPPPPRSLPPLLPPIPLEGGASLGFLGVKGGEDVGGEDVGGEDLGDELLGGEGGTLGEDGGELNSFVQPISQSINT